MAKQQCVMLIGPTGVGKTMMAEKLADAIKGEIVNGDLGQFYVPLNIGTAKPDWRTAPVAHHLFDILATPVHFEVKSFRKKVEEICLRIWQRNKIPIIVGGSSYYMTALFFPPQTHHAPIKKREYDSAKNWWQELLLIDPQRAHQIDPHDTYRITRALDIWYSTDIQPSLYKPVYDPFADVLLVWIERDRQDLYKRIDERVVQMIKGGWEDEVKKLIDTPWEPFIQSKKFIGYPQMIAYVRGMMPRATMIATIQTKTRHYAKRQMTFWRMLAQRITQEQTTQKKRTIITTVNLTHEPIDRYIKHLASLIINMSQNTD